MQFHLAAPEIIVDAAGAMTIVFDPKDTTFVAMITQADGTIGPTPRIRGFNLVYDTVTTELVAVLADNTDAQITTLAPGAAQRVVAAMNDGRGAVSIMITGSQMVWTAEVVGVVTMPPMPAAPAPAASRKPINIKRYAVLAASLVALVYGTAASAGVLRWMADGADEDSFIAKTEYGASKIQYGLKKAGLYPISNHDAKVQEFLDLSRRTGTDERRQSLFSMRNMHPENLEMMTGTIRTIHDRDKTAEDRLDRQAAERVDAWGKAMGFHSNPTEAFEALKKATSGYKGYQLTEEDIRRAREANEQPKP